MEHLVFQQKTIFYIEYFGLATGLICVWLNIKKNILGWFFAVISGLCYIFVFADARLYADMGLQCIFICSAIYGIYQWSGSNTKQSGNQSIEIKDVHSLIYWIILAGIISLVFGFILSNYTDAALPWADSLVAGFSLVAQYMLAQRYRQNWILWIGINILSILIYAYKALWPTTFLYIAFLAMAFYGYYTWKEKTIRS